MNRANLQSAMSGGIKPADITRMARVLEAKGALLKLLNEQTALTPREVQIQSLLVQEPAVKELAAFSF